MKIGVLSGNQFRDQLDNCRLHKGSCFTVRVFPVLAPEIAQRGAGQVSQAPLALGKRKPSGLKLPDSAMRVNLRCSYFHRTSFIRSLFPFPFLSSPLIPLPFASLISTFMCLPPPLFCWKTDFQVSVRFNGFVSAAVITSSSFSSNIILRNL